MRLNSVCICALFVASGLFSSDLLQAAENAKSDRPNVLLMIVDDLGKTDIVVDGSTFYETPHLDGLAKSGVRMTNFYSAHPVCSPTRAALMTGKVPQRLGITDWIHPGSGIVLPPSETTLGEAFQQQGYQTAYLGKWHLGEDDASLPTKHGFEWIKGVNRGGSPGSYYFPFHQHVNKPSILDVPDFGSVDESSYLTDVLTTAAIEFLHQRDTRRPFFACLGHYSIHTPIQPPKDLPQKYRDKAEDFFSVSDTPTRPAPFGSTSRGRQDDPNYAAMIENLDQNIGRILTTLEELGQRQNTIVVFTSDNGGLCTMGTNRKVGPTCNLPWRAGKGWTYEGGIRIPTYISWPSGLKPSTCDVPSYSADLYPTLLELCGLPLQPTQHLDGRSLTGAFRGQADENLKKRSIGWYYPHDHGSGHKASAAIQRESWKLIHYLESQTSELYNLVNDPEESNNLSMTEPERMKTMLAELKRWIDETKAK
ncbi:sulfatase [Schlesneria paludicola]|uniref:sulfatase n=1 Tax=Schlesneria paludicola TaxID=360056 RepID=UPI0004925347|nr:sulfatase [Schlesneria paludicola]